MDDGEDGTERLSSFSSGGSHAILNGGQYRCYEVLKSTIFGLATPYGIQLEVRSQETHTDDDVVEDIYHTDILPWLKQRFYLPAGFNIFLGPWSRHSRTGNGDTTRIARIHYRGWEGLVGMKADIEFFDHARLTGVANDMQSNKSRNISLSRKGVGRTYLMESTPSGRKLVWKGSKKILNLVDDGSPRCNGNLKLVNEANPFEPEILAIWKNRTDPTMLGAVMVLDTVCEGDQMMLEEFLCSCLAVVMAERASARGWLGGIGKSGGRKRNKSALE